MPIFENIENIILALSGNCSCSLNLVFFLWEPNMISLFSLFLFFRREFFFFKNMNQINTPQTCSMWFPKQKTNFENCIQTCPNTMVFPFFFFLFFFGSTFVCFLQFEQKRGHVASSVECYMNGVSEEQTIKHIESSKSKSRMVGWILTRNGSNLRRLFQCLLLLVFSLLHELRMYFAKSKMSTHMLGKQ